jgi:hypothetical protein
MSAREIELPSWMPADAQRTWIDIFSVARRNRLREARDVLQRLAKRLEMKDAWRELKHFPNRSPGDLVMMTFTIWLCAFRNQLLAMAPLHADLSFRKLAIGARAVANRVLAINPTIRFQEGITDATLAELDRVAACFERDAATWDRLLKIASPPRKARAHNALQVAFVNEACNFLWQPSGRRPYTLVAILANVTFNVSEHELWDPDRVKKCYASRSRNN